MERRLDRQVSHTLAADPAEPDQNEWLQRADAQNEGTEHREQQQPANRQRVFPDCAVALISSSTSRQRSTSRYGRPLSCSSSKSHHLTRSRRSITVSGKRDLLIVAGLPATIAYEGTSFVTTDPAPTIAPSPTDTPA